MGSLLFRMMLGAGVAAAVMLRDPTIIDAQPNPESTASSDAQRQATAKKLVDDAIVAQDAGDYDKAIGLYRMAYMHAPHPILMFNVGQVHRLAGRLVLAKRFYRRYLELDPNGKEATTARAHLAAIKDTDVSAVGTPLPKAAEAAKSNVVAKPGEMPRAVGTVPQPVRAPKSDDSHRTDAGDHPGRTLRITGLAVGSIGLASAVLSGYLLFSSGSFASPKIDTGASSGVGLASAAAGASFSWRVRAIEGETAQALQMGRSLDQIGQDGAAAERRQNIAHFLAGSLIVGGVVTYVVGYRKARAVRTTALAPAMGPGFAGFMLGGSLP